MMWELLAIMCQNASRSRGYHKLRIYPWISEESIMSKYSQQLYIIAETCSTRMIKLQVQSTRGGLTNRER
jgi:hypothetical protein